MRSFDDVADDRAKFRVVNRIGEVVRLSGFLDIALDVEVDLELLRMLSFRGPCAMPALERHAAELDPVHPPIVRNTLSRVVHASVSVRPGRESDLEALNEIYNHYVRESHSTFDLEPLSMDWRRDWFTHYAETGPHRIFVALDSDRVIGYASSSMFRPKPGYKTSVETSVYIAPHAIGRGAGSRLYSELFRSLEGEDLHRAYAGIALPNPASIALHERFGFRRVALYTEQGRKFGRYWDVAWFERPLGEPI